MCDYNKKLTYTPNHKQLGIFMGGKLGILDEYILIKGNLISLCAYNANDKPF